MPKKSFKDNPALMFISGAEEAGKEQGEQAEQVEQTKQAVAEVPLKAPTTKMPTGTGYKYNPLYVETKTKRLQLVLQPSVFERVKARAKESGLSVNEYCHQILDKATREE